MLHADKKKSNSDINKSHVNIIMLHVDTIYLAFRNLKQKYDISKPILSYI